MISPLYFEYNPTEDRLYVYSDRAQHHGGALPVGEGIGGNHIEAFRDAVAGKIVVEGGSCIIKPMPKTSRYPCERLLQPA